MEIPDEVLTAANRRGAATRAAFPAVAQVRYDRCIGRIVVALSGGLEIGFSPKHAQGLENARPADLEVIEISPSGLGIHFPRVDADIYLPALLEAMLGSKRWMAAEVGRIGGAASTKLKAAAARRNGKLGGRPKKKSAAVE